MIDFILNVHEIVFRLGWFMTGFTGNLFMGTLQAEFGFVMVETAGWFKCIEIVTGITIYPAIFLKLTVVDIIMTINAALR